MDNIDNVLRVGALYWREALDQFDEQLGRSNFDTQKSNDVLSNVLQDLDERKNVACVLAPSTPIRASLFLIVSVKVGKLAKEMGTVTFCKIVNGLRKI